MRTRKYKKPRRIRRLFLAFCEGESEKAYIEMLKRHYQLPITIRTKVSGSQINARLVNRYMKELEVDSDECRVFYVYDSDVKPIVDKLKLLEGKLILSNPCIELWFLLHTRTQNAFLSSSEVVRKLTASHSVWNSYKKGELTSEQQKLLLGNREYALRNAYKLSWPNNPSSNIWEFVKTLNEEQNT